MSFYNLKWSTGAKSASLSNLCAGDYSVTITDAKNCEVAQRGRSQYSGIARVW